MGQIPFVSEGTRYLDGFLAAARPGHHRADSTPPSASPAPSAAPQAELFATEDIKRRLHPLDSFPRLLECVAANRPPTPDDAFRFQWFGLFYQAPRQDAFRLRLRLPGGRLRAFQFAGLAEITQRCAAGEVLLNAQGGLDILGVPLPMAVAIVGEVEGIGLSARQTGGDCVQCVRGGEYDGWNESRPESLYPLICKLEQALAHSRRLADLPGGCEVAFLSANESLPTSRDDSPDRLVLQAVTSDSEEETNFLLIIPSGPGGVWRLPASQVVPGCVRLLETWAAGADRTRQQDVSLAGYCRSLSNEETGALFDRAGWQALPRPSAAELARPAVIAASVLPIPGGRLLSGQLRRIGEILREQNLSEARLIRGDLGLAPGVDAHTQEAVRAVLNTR